MCVGEEGGRCGVEKGGSHVSNWLFGAATARSINLLCELLNKLESLATEIHSGCDSEAPIPLSLNFPLTVRHHSATMVANNFLGLLITRDVGYCPQQMINKSGLTAKISMLPWEHKSSNMISDFHLCSDHYDNNHLRIRLFLDVGENIY